MRVGLFVYLGTVCVFAGERRVLVWVSVYLSLCVSVSVYLSHLVCGCRWSSELVSNNHINVCMHGEAFEMLIAIVVTS